MRWGNLVLKGIIINTKCTFTPFPSLVRFVDGMHEIDVKMTEKDLDHMVQSSVVDISKQVWIWKL